MTKDRQFARIFRSVWLLPGLTALFLCLLLGLNAREAGKIVPAAPQRTGVPQGARETAVFAETGDRETDRAPEPVKKGTPSAPQEDRLDLNRATVEELEPLPGIGPVLAARIVAYRAEHGPFPTVEAVTEVSGIGEGKFSAMEPYICVTP